MSSNDTSGWRYRVTCPGHAPTTHKWAADARDAAGALKGANSPTVKTAEGRILTPWALGQRVIQEADARIDALVEAADDTSAEGDSMTGAAELVEEAMDAANARDEASEGQAGEDQAGEDQAEEGQAEEDQAEEDQAGGGGDDMFWAAVILSVEALAASMSAPFTVHVAGELVSSHDTVKLAVLAAADLEDGEQVVLIRDSRGVELTPIVAGFMLQELGHVCTDDVLAACVLGVLP